MKVLKNRRTYNTEIYDNEDGTFKYECHTGHIHYVNKLKLGDGDNSTLRKIDTTLIWDEITRTWGFKYHNFHPTIPEYSDDWIIFRDLYKEKDQIVKFKPVCLHIKGKLINNQVVYVNAFGNDIDLLVYTTASQLMKVVRFNTKPTNDINLDFEFEHPDKIYLDNLTLADDRTYIKPMSTWDNAGHRIKQKYTFIFGENKKYLRKLIKASDIMEFKDAVYTDAPVSYYAGAGDGNILVSGATWATLRAATTGTADGTGSDNTCCQGSKSGATYYLRRSFFPIDTSAIGAGSTITAATFYQYSSASGSTTETTNKANIALVLSTQANPASLANGDFDALDLNRQCDTDILIATYNATAQYYTWVLNLTGLGNISKIGWSNFAFRPASDFDDAHVPTALSQGSGRFSEDADVNKRPYLSVTVSAPPTAPSLCNITSITSTGCIVNWTDNSSDETGFKVYQDGVLITTTAAGETHYDVSGLTPNTDYNFYVKATNANGDSTASNTAYMTTTGVGITVQGTKGRLKTSAITAIEWEDEGINYAKYSTKVITETYTVDNWGPKDHTLFCSGTFAVTLPTATDGRELNIINYGTGIITLTGTINAIVNPTMDPGYSMVLIGNGTNWYVKSIGATLV